MNTLEAEARLPIALQFHRPEGHEGDWFPDPMLRVAVVCANGTRRVEMPALIDTGCALSAWPLNIARLLLGAEADRLEPDRRTDFDGIEHPCFIYPPGLDVEVGGYRVRLHAEFINTKRGGAILGLNDFLGQFDMVCRWADRELRLYPRPSVELAEEAQQAAA